MAKPRVPAETQKLAYWFVTDILGESFDYRKHGRHLKDAKRLINPDEDVVALDPAMVKGCILAMKAGMFDFDGVIQSMWPINYGNDDGTYYEQFLAWVKTGPRWYVPSEVSIWELCTGLIAYHESSDTINIQSHDLPLPITS